MSVWTLLVCLSLAFPSIASADTLPSDAGNYAATATTVDGDVSLLKDFEEWAIIPGDRIMPKQTIVTGIDGHALFAVADGSTFEVFPNSKIIFRNNPPTWKDMLDVFLGKVRIKIEHFGDKPNPNRVITPTAVISVRGTVFDISVDENDESTVVTVEEGEVGVEHALLPTGNTAILQAGDTIRVSRDEPIAKNRIDKGGVFQQVLRMAMDAVVVAGRPGSIGGAAGGSGGGGGGGGVGDTDPGSVGGSGGPSIPTTAPPIPISGAPGAPTGAPPSF